MCGAPLASEMACATWAGFLARSGRPATGCLGKPPSEGRAAIVITLQDAMCATVNKKYYRRWQSTSQDSREEQQARVQAWRSQTSQTSSFGHASSSAAGEEKPADNSAGPVPVLQMLVRPNRQLKEWAVYDGGVQAYPDILTTISSRAADHEAGRQRCPSESTRCYLNGLLGSLTTGLIWQRCTCRFLPSSDD